MSASEVDALRIALQPIHDAEDRHVADRLRYRCPEGGAEDSLAATAQALATVIYELDDSRRPEARELLLDLPEAWLERAELLPEPARQMILGLPPALAPTPERLAGLAALRQRGYRLLVPATALAGTGLALAPLADLVGLPHPEALDDAGLAHLHQQGSQLLAENIQTPEQLARFRELGCHLFDAGYLARPTFYASHSPSRHGNRAAQLRLINALYREDVDLSQLFELLIQMPQLHVAILRRANSSHYNPTGRQVDLRQAIQLLGLNELRRLVMTLSLAGELPSSKLKVRLALTRAFMCRQLARPFPGIDPEAAFTTGLFSMIGPLLDVPQESLLAELPLGDEVSRALATREGLLGALLALSEEHERQVAGEGQLASADRLQQCYLEALVETSALMEWRQAR